MVRNIRMGRLAGFVALPLLIVGCNGSTPTAPNSSMAGATAADDVPLDPPPQTEPPVVSEPIESEKPESAEMDSALTPRMVDWAGVQTEVAKHAGKVVVLDVWSTACEPCMREFPYLVTLQADHPEDVVCIAFSVDYAGIKSKPPEFYLPRVTEFLASQKAERVIHLMSSVAADDLFIEMDLDSIPAIYVFDRDGKLSKRFDNRTPAEGEEGISYPKQVLPLVAELLGSR
ncbi:MAG: redoxin family protein [Planctomycetaceae bacterium]|nr:redoxin family protein [Planctomycetaceae bacterium]